MATKKAATKSAGMKELEKNNFPTHLVMSFESEDEARGTSTYLKLGDHTVYVTEDGEANAEINSVIDNGNEYIVVYVPSKIIKVSKTTKEVLV